MSDNSHAHLFPLGAWIPDARSQLMDFQAATQALQMLGTSCAVVLEGGTLRLALHGRPMFGPLPAPQAPDRSLPMLAWLPAFSSAQLGDARFVRDYGARWPLVAGSMANGIASVELVEACAKAGILSFFGAGGLSFDAVEAAVSRLEGTLKGKPWGANLIHSPQEPVLEDRVGALLERTEVPAIEASAFLDLTLPLVRLRARSLQQNPDGSIRPTRRIMGKVSRAEVARKFLAPPPQNLLAELVRRGELSDMQARLASSYPLCDELTAEADSGGHTDNRPLVVLLPALQAVQEEVASHHPLARQVRIGAGGGIGTPDAVMAAFSLGAAYVVTGSINQCTLESGTSASAKALLAVASSTEVTMAPAADMFELGVNLQVLSRGTLFPVRARKLYELYRRSSGLESMSAEDTKLLEGILRAPIETVWQDCERFFEPRDPAQLERARKDSRHKLALICRWYLGRASRLAIDGAAGREQDYQIWCGPAIGAFNAWVKGSWLEPWQRRSVVSCSRALLGGAAVATRLAQLRMQGIQPPSGAIPVMSEAQLEALDQVRTPEPVQEHPSEQNPLPGPVSGEVDTALIPRFEPIAIVGIGALFPDAPDLKSFWRLLRQGTDTIGDVPPTHWSPDDYFDEDPKVPDKTYARRGAFLRPYPFDPTAFGIPPGILEATDTSQLLGLVVGRAALADAGYTDATPWPRERTSVLLGVTGTQELVIPLGARLGHPHWRRALQEAGVDEATAQDVIARIGRAFVGWQENSFPGLLGNVVAGRIANRLNLGGTNSVVDAACASSFAALHLACLELSSGRCDIALSGGVDALNDIFMHMCFSKTPALSPTGDVRPFDASADGTLLGEGIGMVVLRRLVDAQREGQRIYAVIRGIGTSSDGRAKSIYAPLPDGQARALRAGYTLAGISPREVGLIEAHGTGTKAGDACEVQALKEVYQAAGAGLATTALGSVKSQIGHTKAAAGAAGLIKAALALHYRVIPPTLKVKHPNPALHLNESPFYLPTTARPWAKSAETPRRAAVSAFGFGGSNFHTVLEAASPGGSPEPAWDGSVCFWTFSGASEAELIPKIKAARAALSASEAAPWEQAELERQSRAEFEANAPVRVVLVGLREQSDALLRKAELELGQKNATASIPEGLFIGRGAAPGKLAMLYPGQGSQYLHMGRELCCVFPELKDALDDAPDVAGWIFPPPVFEESAQRAQLAELTSTEHAQPALALLEAGLTRILVERFGVQPQVTAGHSFGELTALFLARRLDQTQLLSLARQRGQLMSSQGRDRGTMLAVSAPLTELASLVEHEGSGLVLANLNTPQQGILSGSRAAIDRVEVQLKARGFTSRRLEVAAAFHSPLVADAEEQLRHTLEAHPFPRGRIDVIANSTGLPYPEDPGESRKLLAGQLARPVRFVDVIETLYEAGARTFIEVGPRNVLSGLLRQILGQRPHVGVAVDPSGGRNSGLCDFARALGQLAALGYPVRVRSWDGGKDHSAPPARKMTVHLSGANHRDPLKPLPPRLHSGAQGTHQSQRLSGLAGTSTVSHTEATPAMNGAPTGTKSPRPAQSNPAQVSQNNLQKRAAVPPTTATATRTPPYSSGSIQTSLEVRMVDPLQQTRHASQPGDLLAQAHAIGEQGWEEHRGDARPSAPGLIVEALRAGQEQLRLIQLIQAQTASVHQRFLEGQDAANRGFLALVNSQQRMMERLLNGHSDASVSPELSTALPLPRPSEAFAGVLPTSMPSRPSDQSGLGGFPFPVSSLSGAFAPSTIGVGQPPTRPQSTIAGAMPPLGGVAAPAGVGTAFDNTISALMLDNQPAPALRSDQAVRRDSEPVHALRPPPSQRAANPGQKAGGTPLTQPVAAVSAAPSAPAMATGSVPLDLTPMLLQVVSDLTGYPSSMLGLELDMESDLGIDSIKRVEILSVLSSRVPGLKAVEPDKLSTMRTLEQVRTYLSETQGGSLGKSEAQAEKRAAHRLPVSASLPLEPDISRAALSTSTRLPLGGNPLPADASSPREHLTVDPPAAPPSQQALTTRGGAERSSASPPGRPASGDTLPTESAAANRPALERRLRVPTRIEPLPHLGPEACAEALRGTWLIVSTAPRAEGLSAALAQNLMGLGAEATVFSADAPPIQVAAPLRGLILLVDEPLPWSASGDDQLVHLFAWTRAQAKHLRQSNSERPPVFVTVTCQDGLHGLDGTRPVSACSAGKLAQLRSALQEGTLNAGLAGLTRTVAQEWPEVRACALDLAPELTLVERTERTIAELVALCRHLTPMETSGQAQCAELGVRPNGRYGFEWLESQLEPSSQLPPLTPGDVVLVSGGARGVTAACALSLARDCQARLSPSACTQITLALLGRTEPPAPEPAWLAGCQDEASIKRAWLTNGFPGEQPGPRQIGEAAARTLAAREIRYTLDALRQTGVNVQYLCADIRKAEDLERAIAGLSHHGPVTWLIHGAGFLQDRRIEDKTDTQLLAVLQTKVLGLRQLLNALRDAPLRGLVLFSSVSGRFGRRGQSDYAMANRILDRVAGISNRLGLPAAAVAWGPWEGGMVSPGLKREFEKEGVGLISLEAGGQQLIRELECLAMDQSPGLVLLGQGISGFLSSGPGAGLSGAPRVGDAWFSEVKFNLDARQQSWLREHSIGGHPVLPFASILEFFTDTLKQLHPGLFLTDFKDVKLLRGLVLDPPEPQQVSVRAGLLQSTPGGGQVTLELHDMVGQVRAKGVALLAPHPKRQEAKQQTDAEPDELLPFQLEPTAEQARPWYSDEWLFHGHHWQVVSRVTGIKHKSISFELLPTTSNSALFMTHIIDALFQGMILWSRALHQSPCLPTGVSQLTVSSIPAAHWETGPLLAQLVLERVDRSVVDMSAQVCTPSGEMILKGSGLRSIMSQALVEKFRQTAA